MFPRDSAARPAHLVHTLNEQRFLLTALQNDYLAKASILRLEGNHCRTKEQVLMSDRGLEFSEVFLRGLTVSSTCRS